MLTLSKPQISVEEHVGLAHAIASQYIKPKEKVRDSEQFSEACLALVKAAADYDPDQGQFSTVAWQAMKNGIVDSFRHANRRKKKATFDVGVDLTQIPQKNNKVKPEDLLKCLLVDNPGESDLDRSDKQVLVEVFLGDGKVQNIADRMGVSRERIYQRLRRAIFKIRERHAALIEQYREIINE